MITTINFECNNSNWESIFNSLNQLHDQTNKIVLKKRTSKNILEFYSEVALKDIVTEIQSSNEKSLIANSKDVNIRFGSVPGIDHYCSYATTSTVSFNKYFHLIREAEVLSSTLTLESDELTSLPFSKYQMKILEKEGIDFATGADFGFNITPAFVVPSAEYDLRIASKYVFDDMLLSTAPVYKVERLDNQTTYIQLVNELKPLENDIEFTEAWIKFYRFMERLTQKTSKS